MNIHLAVGFLTMFALISCSNNKNDSDKTIRSTTNTSAVKAAGVKSQSSDATLAIAKKRNVGGFTLRSSAFDHNGKIPDAHANSGNGADNQPIPLTWSNPPEGTQSFVIQMVDLDVGITRKVHWILSNIPASVLAFPIEVTDEPVETPIPSAPQLNRVFEYVGPFPADGTVHHYEITIYAMSEDLSFRLDSSNSNKNKSVLEGSSLGFASIIGTYQNKK